MTHRRDDPSPNVSRTLPEGAGRENLHGELLFCRAGTEIEAQTSTKTFIVSSPPLKSVSPLTGATPVLSYQIFIRLVGYLSHGGSIE